ncbi:MAG: DUF1934 domain-containing protein [Oscillospiraceae bacterium]|jgi:uncharacterized beta-barrel protein YwiB (DUF1934 family)|nr:DUF1934 domain-containing protein [Oscillospiraceae bacterium]
MVAKIAYKSKITPPDGEILVQTGLGQGVLKVDENEIHLAYIEVTSGNRVSLLITLREVVMRRVGDYSLEMRFIPGESTHSEYITPHGFFAMDIHTQNVLNTLKAERGGMLALSYELDFGSHKTQNLMQIRVKNAEEK